LKGKLLSNSLIKDHTLLGYNKPDASQKAKGLNIPRHNAAGFEAMLRGVQNKFIFHVEER